ncbi:MAG: isocitrate lyase/phosphoenolpyruvate mutase family protein [Gemmatimonadetes bacterium]|nr:isocitrate lyase/phosphoenolpyruvate mutase family protein [Gemmatimonadota bacterium]
MRDSARRLRSLFAAPGMIRLVGAHDALGAKLAERHGFEGVWSSGFEISTSHGVPDASILTMSDYLAAAQRMADAVDIPVVADCDTGYGNSNNVIRMVRQFEAAGIAAVCMEDKLFPKVNSFTPGRQELASVAEFVGKILAAKNAQRTAEFTVIARIEALIAGWPVAEALRRADAYVQAGADAILVHDKDPAGAGLREFLARWSARVPVVVVPTAYPQVTAAELESLGVKMVIYANQGLRAAVAAMNDTFRRIAADGSTANVESAIAPMRELFELQGMPELERAERDYLRVSGPPVRAIVLSAGDHRDAPSMRQLAVDIPLAALDVNGKSLLQRQAESLAHAGVRDITVVTGYRHEAVACDGVTVVHNAEWATTGEAASLMAVPAAGGAAGEARVLVLYGDLMFDADLVRTLLRSDADVAVVVDRGHVARDNSDDKRRDLVHLAGAPAPDRRFLRSGVLPVVSAIGKSIGADGAHGEFAGFALFSPAGWRALLAQYDRRRTAAPDAPLHEADSFARASLTDLLQALIDDGTSVVAVEVTSGWLEIHSFDDYQRACRLVAR